jgi:DNA repair photolyase
VIKDVTDAVNRVKKSPSAPAEPGDHCCLSKGKVFIRTDEIIHKKPVYLVRTSPFFDKSGFAHKKLCDGKTFTAGTACAYSCTYCYVEGQTLRHAAVSTVLQHSKLPFNKVVIRRAEAVRQLALQITRRAGKTAANGRHPGRCEDLLGEAVAVRLGLGKRVAIYRGKKFKKQVLFASAFVDVAATKELALETVEICEVILRLTDFKIRLLSKSPLLYSIVALELAKRHPEARARMILGLSVGTLDDAIARAIEPDAPSPAQRLAALRDLQDAGFRTFGMACPILPQADPMTYAKQVVTKIRAQRCEHIWAEPVNARSKRKKGRRQEDSFRDTLRALRRAVKEGHPDRKIADRFENVINDKVAWGQYCREMFEAFAKVAPPRTLRWMQYPTTDKDIEWWLGQRKLGALVLGPHANNYKNRRAAKLASANQAR